VVERDARGKPLVKVTVIVEGGGNTRAEQAALRKGFSGLFAKVRPPDARTEVRCGGGRGQTYADFRKELSRTDGLTRLLLLVDSEGPVPKTSPWNHVASREGDGWEQPPGATDDHLHFMVQMMEAWILADPVALADFYGHEFKNTKLPRARNLETVSKGDLLDALERATRGSKTKGSYKKVHAFDLVGTIDPAKVRKACPVFGERFFRELERP
jgi:hypothetical protein